jgi:hypothetical protein
MAVGSIGAAGNGAAWPIFAVLFSKFTDAFGGSSPNFKAQVRGAAAGRRRGCDGPSLWQPEQAACWCQASGGLVAVAGAGG